MRSKSVRCMNFFNFFFWSGSALNNFERMGFVLGWENWERYEVKALLSLVIVRVLF